MRIRSAAALVQELRQNRLLPATQLDALAPLCRAGHHDPRTLARQLMQRGWLTPFQINQLLQGHGQHLVLGQYVLLERLGEGGMGQVFKARQQRLDRLVALKLIRKDRAEHPEAVRRFLREVRAVAQLSHPHIVVAYDADQIGDTYFIAMEYIDGIDLERLVERSGPLPVPTACEAIRQAALGLQHAYEHGLVHRDIKPSNLIVARSGARDTGLGIVKILDLGLARWQRLENPSSPPISSDEAGPLTQPGIVIGTPDFVAPEQALNARMADIRSDLYSLGCTWYYLLAGDVPFPGGQPLEKLIRHRCEAPIPIEQLRPEVPAAVAAILRRLLAKEPQDRFQTPAELVAALTALSPQELQVGDTQPEIPHEEQDTFAALIAAVSSVTTQGQATVLAAPLHPRSGTRGSNWSAWLTKVWQLLGHRGHRWWLASIGLLVLLVMLLGLLWTFWPSKAASPPSRRASLSPSSQPAMTARAQAPPAAFPDANLTRKAANGRER